MSPSTVGDPERSVQLSPDGFTNSKASKFRLDRHLRRAFPDVVSGKGNYLFTKDGRAVFDASTGAAVSCLGHGNERVLNTIRDQLTAGIPYLATTFWGSDIVEELCKELISGTDGAMARAYLTGSGSEAIEASVKLARQYFYESDKKTPRKNFIAREESYHGNTLGALSISGHRARREPYLPFLMDNVYRVSACNPYRQRKEGESDESFVARKAAELEAKFEELGPETVIAFIAEPIVGAALGCIPYVPGYLRAVRDICHKHGALLILDEIMCGMGRSGTLHAWQGEGVSPDIETIGKGLAGGYQPVAAVLMSEKVVKALSDGSGQFVHGQTFQGMPVQACAALEVQRIVKEENLLQNVRIQGAYLEKQLKALLGDHPNVGDIRGKGLFWGIEFVRDKGNKEPFDPSLGIAQRISDCSLSPSHNMTVYPGGGTADGVYGDHIILAPAYTVTKEDVNHITQVITDVINEVFRSVPR